MPKQVLYGLLIGCAFVIFGSEAGYAQRKTALLPEDNNWGLAVKLRTRSYTSFEDFMNNFMLTKVIRGGRSQLVFNPAGRAFKQSVDPNGNLTQTLIMASLGVGLYLPVHGFEVNKDIRIVFGFTAGLKERFQNSVVRNEALRAFNRTETRAFAQSGQLDFQPTLLIKDRVALVFTAGYGLTWTSLMTLEETLVFRRETTETDFSTFGSSFFGLHYYFGKKSKNKKHD